MPRLRLSLLHHTHPLSSPLSTQQFNLPFWMHFKSKLRASGHFILKPFSRHIINHVMVLFEKFAVKCTNSNALLCEFWQMQSRVTKPLLRYGTWICFFLTLSHAASFWDFVGNSHGPVEAGIHVIFFPSYFWLLWNLRYISRVWLQHVQDMSYAFLCHLALPSPWFPLSVIFKSCWGIYNSTSWFSNPFLERDWRISA